MVVKSRVLRSAANGELHSPVTPEEKPKRSKVATHGRKNAKAAAPEGDAAETSPSPVRRTSARIQIKQLAEKELLMRQRVELLDEPDSASKKKKTNSQVKRKRNTSSVKDEVGEGKGEVVEDKAVVVPVSNDVTKSKDGDESKPMEVCAPENSRTGDDVGPANMVEKSDHVKVKETLRLFNKYYLHFVQEEEKRCKKAEVAEKASKRSKSKKEAPVEDTKNKSKRPDLKAISKMLESNEILNHEKRIGNVPGINIGHRFYSRAEMVAVGFHSHWLNGIDYMGLSYSKMVWAMEM